MASVKTVCWKENVKTQGSQAKSMYNLKPQGLSDIMVKMHNKKGKTNCAPTQGNLP